MTYCADYIPLLCPKECKFAKNIVDLRKHSPVLEPYVTKHKFYETIICMRDRGILKTVEGCLKEPIPKDMPFDCVPYEWDNMMREIQKKHDEIIMTMLKNAGFDLKYVRERSDEFYIVEITHHIAEAISYTRTLWHNNDELGEYTMTINLNNIDMTRHVIDVSYDFDINRKVSESQN